MAAEVRDVAAASLASSTVCHGADACGAVFEVIGSFQIGGRGDLRSSPDGTIRLWDLATRTQVAELRGHTNYVHAVAFSPDGTRLASASGDTTVRIWDTLPKVERNRK